MTLLKINYKLIHHSWSSDKLEQIPNNPPHPPVKVLEGDSSKMFLVAYLASELEISAINLAEAARATSGEYTKGHEAPAISVAFSTGAILTAFTAIEAYVNETITINAAHNRRRGPIKLFQKGLMEQTLLTRIESLLIAMGVEVDWSKEPYQSLRLLSTTRNSLAHHEGSLGVIASEGYFPKKALKDVVRIIKSPYRDTITSPYHWYTHIITPNGAVWAVNVMLEIISIIDTELDQEPSS